MDGGIHHLCKYNNIKNCNISKQFKLIKVARYSFSGSIPPKFERKPRRYLQRFWEINTTVVLEKDETFLWSGLQWHRSCHSNEMTPSPILLAAVFLGTGNWSSKTVHGSIFPPHPWHLWLVNHSQQSLLVLCGRHQSIQRTVKLSKGQWSPTNLMSIVYFPRHLNGNFALIPINAKFYVYAPTRPLPHYILIRYKP